MAKKIAEVFVDVMAAAGVDRIYGVAGDSLNGITDSVRKRHGTDWVGMRHEIVDLAGPICSVDQLDFEKAAQYLTRAQRPISTQLGLRRWSPRTPRYTASWELDEAGDRLLSPERL